MPYSTAYPVINKKGVSHVCGENASASVIAIGKASKAKINSISEKEDRNTKRMTMLAKNTQALPSSDRSYVLSENRALVRYLCFPNLTPTGSASPSPKPLMRTGIKTSVPNPSLRKRIMAGTIMM